MSITWWARVRFSESWSCSPWIWSNFFRRHAGAGKHAGALHIFGGGNDDDQIDRLMPAAFEQQGDVEHHPPRACLGVRRERLRGLAATAGWTIASSRESAALSANT